MKQVFPAKAQTRKEKNSISFAPLRENFVLGFAPDGDAGTFWRVGQDRGVETRLAYCRQVGHRTSTQRVRNALDQGGRAVHQ